MQTTSDRLPVCDEWEQAPLGDRYRAPALDKGLDILELLSEQKEGLTRTEITRELGRNASEIYRMLERLVARRYVTRSSGGDRYTLGLKLFALAHRHPPINRLIAEALPLMQRFADTAEQSCHLSIYDHGNLLVIAQVDAPGPWGVSVRLGSHVGLADTASGRVLLSFQSSERRAHMVADHRTVAGETPMNEQELAFACQSIRQSGYVRQDSGQAYGVTDLSAPILGPTGHAIAVLSCPYMRRIDAHMAPSVDDVVRGLYEATHPLSMRHHQFAASR
ncbi:IclR family transcriptional regulator [Burkholderia cepacia]|uniref:IclR family transcriptional regulator n=1 Tax=Burkholderia cepacia TaxID=292 RepID=A0AAX2RDT4_BURCE|nr:MULTISPECIES: IclR family transcriptional regulator [Burkholderia]KVA54850.1 IclR family transcriptional regulator [Burkholderia cepacia]KVA55926.1 IclR family transcriptional regulator [Burkholderia cepacia]KVA79224.1 IclR family transcriptional regulator [Burkholderia cepacia]KVA83210.1 IclR family transcriptional regulator [Burkholderia cepacia]KVA91621.1 IclR family transcriptional regulator [Burkholderia cepacia]